MENFSNPIKGAQGCIPASSKQIPRRNFLRYIGAGSLASLTSSVLGSPLNAECFLNTHQQTDADPNYLFAPGLLYFSTATMGPCSKKVLESAMTAWYALESNPHFMGYGKGEVLDAAEHVREKAAGLIGCSADEIVITRSTTDGMNAVAQGLQLKKGDHVLTTDQEHDGGSMCWQYLERYNGIKIDRVKINPAEKDVKTIVDSIGSAISGNTRVISISHILSSTGLHMPLAQIFALAKNRNIFCVVDGAQAVGAIEVNVRALGCHAYATSGHKWLMGPKGTGLLYLANGTEQRVKPIQFFDNRNFYNESTGVGNLPGVIGLGTAIDLVKEAGISYIQQHNLALRNRIYRGLKDLKTITVLSAPPGPLATALISIKLPEDVDSAEAMKRLLQKHKLMVKMVPKRWFNGIRLSPHIFNTEQEVGEALSVLWKEFS